MTKRFNSLVTGGVKVPYIVVKDKGFSLQWYLIRPHPRKMETINLQLSNLESRNYFDEYFNSAEGSVSWKWKHTSNNNQQQLYTAKLTELWKHNLYGTV